MDPTAFTYGDSVAVSGADGEVERSASVCAIPCEANDEYLVEYSDGTAETVPANRLSLLPD